MNQYLSSGAPTDCKSAYEPVLRDRLEKALVILNSAQCAISEINGKLFSPQPQEGENASECVSNELEVSIDRVYRMASRLESSLSYINDKL